MEQNARAPMAGKTVLVTGASGGIGNATALGLARMGAHLAITGRDRERAEAAAREIRAASGPVDVFIGDLSSQLEVRRLAADVLQSLPRIDVLINNVGGYWDSRHVTAAKTSSVTLELFALYRLPAPRRRHANWCGVDRAHDVASHRRHRGPILRALANSAPAPARQANRDSPAPQLFRQPVLVQQRVQQPGCKTPRFGASRRTADLEVDLRMRAGAPPCRAGCGRGDSLTRPARPRQAVTPVLTGAHWEP